MPRSQALPTCGMGKVFPAQPLKPEDGTTGKTAATGKGAGCLQVFNAGGGLGQMKVEGGNRALGQCPSSLFGSNRSLKSDI